MVDSFNQEGVAFSYALGNMVHQTGRYMKIQDVRSIVPALATNWQRRSVMEDQSPPDYVGLPVGC